MTKQMRHLIECEEQHYSMVQSLEHVTCPPTCLPWEKKFTKKIPFTALETDSIEQYFADALEEGRAITTLESKEFCKVRPWMQRTYKQVQDKVRNLLK